ncbi:hypothetical protein SDC9_191265 [bioreactor metagenome]|uniref:Uncharacterized protein n=1 Tax=bioreactor metagenome TaxID=1076179 RepID=A0A645HXE7_9ZZZZ
MDILLLDPGGFEDFDHGRHLLGIALFRAFGSLGFCDDGEIDRRKVGRRDRAARAADRYLIHWSIGLLFDDHGLRAGGFPRALVNLLLRFAAGYKKNGQQRRAKKR